MADLSEFEAILVPNAPLGSKTGLGVGGKVDWLATPRNREELARLVSRLRAQGVPFRILGGGYNVLVRDEGVAGMVIQLVAEEFCQIRVEGRRIEAGAGATLSDLIAAGSKASLAGLEGLVGIPGTVGGALARNVGDRSGDIAQYVYSVTSLEPEGQWITRQRADLRFGYRTSNLEGEIILSAAFELDPDEPEDIARRIKKLWISKKANQPFEFEASEYCFQNPRGLDAAELIERAGLRGAKVGGAELSDRNPVFIVAREGATSRDVLRLIDLVQSKIEEQLGIHMELQIDVW